MYVYDSEITVRLMGTLALEAARMAREEQSPEDISTQLNELRATFGNIYCR